MTARLTLSRWDDLPLDKVTEMVARKTVIGSHDTIAQAYYKRGALVPEHRHATAQFIYVLQGALRLVADGRETTVRDGEIVEVPAGVLHQAEAMDDTFVISVQCTQGS